MCGAPSCSGSAAWAILVLAVAILPLLGVGGSQLFKAEVAGPIKDSKLTPRVKETAKGLWGIYATFSLGLLPGVLGRRHDGHRRGDAHVHHREPGRALVARRELCALRVAAARRDGDALHAGGQLQLRAVFRRAAKGPLARLLARPGDARNAVALVGGGLLVALVLWVKGVYGPVDALRHGVFHAISVGSTTGYATVDYLHWPVFAPLFMLLLSGVATSAGSTGVRHQDGAGAHPASSRRGAR